MEPTSKRSRNQPPYSAQSPPHPLSRQTVPPQPAYLSQPGSVLSPDRSLYAKLASATRRQIYKHTLPPRSGHAFTAPAGSIIRISTPLGAQVGDLNLWSLHNPRERFWAARTRQLHASHVSDGDRLWSCLPYLRPMVTIVSDSLGGEVYGVDAWGGRCHDLLGTRCDPYVRVMLNGEQAGAADEGSGEGGKGVREEYDFHCHSNLTRAVLPYGLTEFDVHDVINLFQVTGLDEEGRYFMEASPARKGDFIEFFAEMDLLLALSTCPGGDLSVWGWEEGGGDGKPSMKDTCKPLKIEVFEIEDKEVFANWKAPETPKYRGLHGMKVPSGEDH